MGSSKKQIVKMVIAAMLLALALILPIFTGQIKQIGNALCPMHIPVMLCGFFCGPWYAAVVGFIAPLLRFAIFGMPVIMPSGIGMSFELAAYGLAVAILYDKLPKKKINIYVSLISSMIIGRLVWGIVRVILLGLGKAQFGWTMFIVGAFLNAVPGIIIQIILIPIIVMAINKNIYFNEQKL